MRYVRNILLFIAIIFAFVMQAEIYQNMLWIFSGAYYLSSRYTISENDLESFISDIEVSSQKHNVHVFSCLNQRVSNYQSKLTIYGDDAVVRGSLKNTMDIEEKTYTALIGGITEVEFESFNNIKNMVNAHDIMISYIGNENDITDTYRDLTASYSLTPPEFWQSKESDMMIIVWGLAAILMIVLNIIEAIRRKKEVVIRASLGESAGVIALKAAASDIVSYAVLFVLTKIITSLFMSGAYEEKLILLIYCMGAVLSVIPYIVFVRFDVRKAFANASDKQGMLYLLNAFKVIVSAVTIFTITTNLGSISGNFLTNSGILKNHYNDSYFGVIASADVYEENDGKSAIDSFWSELYEKEYNTVKPVICIGCRIGDRGNCIFVNHNAEDMLQGFSEKLANDDKNADMVVFIPKGKNAESYKRLAEEEIDSLAKNAENLIVVFKEYSDRQYFNYLNSNRENAVDGLSKVKNPIVIYQTNENSILNGGYIETKTFNGEVIYSADKNIIQETAAKYSEHLGSHYFVLTNVGEDYNYTHNFLVKLIGFISSLCVLVLLLNIAVIISEVKTEFDSRSMEISLKKVLGYSLYERHKRFICVNIIENIIVIAAVCVFSLFMLNTSVMIALTVGILLFALEMTIIFTNILWIEKTNISKSLKGGCL